MSDLSELKDLLEVQSRSFLEFKRVQDERLKNLERNLSMFAKKAGQREIRSPKRVPTNNY